MSNTENNKFSSNVGQFLSITKCNEWRDKHAENQKTQGKEINSIYFGKDNIQHLLNIENAVGIRIYCGIEVDETGKEIEKMIIFPVDKDGNDILIKPFNFDFEQANLTVSSVEDEAIKNEEDTELGALDGGWPCPPYCGGPKDPKPPTT